MDRQITSALTGFQVTWAYSGHEGLALLPLNSFDAAVVNAPLTDYPPEGFTAGDPDSQPRGQRC